MFYLVSLAFGGGKGQRQECADRGVRTVDNAACSRYRIARDPDRRGMEERLIPAGPQRPAERWARLAARRIAARVRPRKIILFGSYAYGRPRRGSDVDLLVIVDGPRDRFKRYALVDEAVGEHRWPIDILVRSPEEIDHRLRIKDSFFMEIMRRGKVLYES